MLQYDLPDDLYAVKPFIGLQTSSSYRRGVSVRRIVQTTTDQGEIVQGLSHLPCGS